MCNSIRSFFRITFFAVISTFVLFSVSSCSDLFSYITSTTASNSNAGETITFTGTVRNAFADGSAVPAEYAALFAEAADGAESASASTAGRSAIPNLPTDTATTTVTATATGESSPIPTINGDSFTIGLKSGKVWTVTVTRTYTGGITLSDSANLDLTTVPVTSHDFVLKPDMSGTGNIYLGWNFDACDSIKYFTIDIEGQTQKAFSKNTISGNVNNGKWAPEGTYSYTTYPTISINSVASGHYNALIRFYNNETDKVLLYFTEQTINVYKGMTTSKWVLSNAENVDSNGYFKPTNSLLQSFGMQHIFVGDCGTEAPSDETGTGSPYKPYASVAKAVSLANALPKKTAEESPYVIHVKDGLEEDITSAISIQNNITIECWKSTIGDKLGKATITWNGTSSSTMIGVYGTLTIEGIKSEGENPTWSGLVLDGNKTGENPGGGITCGGTLYLNGGEIRNCSYASNGLGNIYGVALNIGESGNVVMTGGKIHHNEVGVHGGSGTVYLRSSGSRFSMSDGMICDNTLENGNNMPGVYISDGQFTMTGGEICRNIASGTGQRYGGGVYIYSTATAIFNMSGGKICANDARSGGAVYVGYNGIFRISGSAYIPAGDSSGNKGEGKNDVWVSSRNSCKFYIGGALTPPAAANGIVATITPDNYEYLSNPVVVLSTDPAPDPTTTLPAECGKFAVTSNNGTQYRVNSEGKIEEEVIEIIDTTSQNVSITDPSKSYILQGVDGQNSCQIDINQNVETENNLTYYITLENVNRQMEVGASGLAIYNTNRGKSLTVNINLIGENRIYGDNHGGIKLVGIQGYDSVINVVFDTQSTGIFHFGANYEEVFQPTNLQIENITSHISIASGCTFIGEIDGNTYSDVDQFFNDAAVSTCEECVFTITR